MCLSSVTPYDLEIEPLLWIPGVAIRLHWGKSWILTFQPPSQYTHVLLTEAKVLQNIT